MNLFYYPHGVAAPCRLCQSCIARDMGKDDSITLTTLVVSAQNPRTRGPGIQNTQRPSTCQTKQPFISFIIENAGFVSRNMPNRIYIYIYI